MTLERNKKPAATATVTGIATTTGGTAVPQRGGAACTLVLQVPVQVPRGDEPINSRNSPTTLNILTSSTDKEETFANRYVDLCIVLIRLLCLYVYCMEVGIDSYTALEHRQD